MMQQRSNSKKRDDPEDPNHDDATEISNGAMNGNGESMTQSRRRPSHTSRRAVSTAYESSRIATTSLAWILVFGTLCLACVVGHHYLLEWEHAEERAIAERIQREEMDPMTREWEEKLLELQQENVNLRQQAVVSTESPKEHSNNMKETKQMISKIHQLQEYKDHMHQAIQMLSKRYVLEKFGTGPHRVEIQLDFDPSSSIPGDADKFVIELAPLDLMPHSIYTFLSQVSLSLYNGCSFHRNAGHVVQGGPAPNYNTPPNAKLRKKFVDAQLESVRFQEYSEKFPHVKYTLGYAGRPGGPDFYVSTRNNTLAHGPGGQGGYADKSEADPCFAKVIEGFEAVDRMAKSPVADQSYRHMEHNVAIRHMKILTDSDELK